MGASFVNERTKCRQSVVKRGIGTIMVYRQAAIAEIGNRPASMCCVPSAEVLIVEIEGQLCFRLFPQTQEAGR